MTRISNYIYALIFLGLPFSLYMLSPVYNSFSRNLFGGNETAFLLVYLLPRYYYLLLAINL